MGGFLDLISETEHMKHNSYLYLLSPDLMYLDLSHHALLTGFSPKFRQMISLIFQAWVGLDDAREMIKPSIIKESRMNVIWKPMVFWASQEVNDKARDSENVGYRIIDTYR